MAFEVERLSVKWDVDNHGVYHTDGRRGSPTSIQINCWPSTNHCFARLIYSPNFDWEPTILNLDNALSYSYLLKDRNE